MPEQAPATPYMSVPGAHVKLIERDVSLARQRSARRHNEHVIEAARRRRRHGWLRAVFRGARRGWERGIKEGLR